MALAFCSRMSRSGWRSPSGPKKRLTASSRHAPRSCQPQLGRGSATEGRRALDMDQFTSSSKQSYVCVQGPVTGGGPFWCGARRMQMQRLACPGPSRPRAGICF
jgi:hypothetical protein